MEGCTKTCYNNLADPEMLSTQVISCGAGASIRAFNLLGLTCKPLASIKLLCIGSPCTHPLFLLPQRNRGLLNHQARQNVQPRTCEHFDVDFFLVSDSLRRPELPPCFCYPRFGDVRVFLRARRQWLYVLFAEVVALDLFKKTLVSFVVLLSTVLAREMVSNMLDAWGIIRFM